MPIKEKKRLVINFCFICFLTYVISQLFGNCQNNNNQKQDLHNFFEDTLVREPNERDTSKLSLSDTLTVGEVLVLIKDSTKFLPEFKQNPEAFYYSNGRRRDFLLLSEDKSKAYILLGAENGGCLSCVELFEIISKSALSEADFPFNITDTSLFRTGDLQSADLKIVTYPFLRIGNKLKDVENRMRDSGFKLESISGKNKEYVKISEWNVVSVLFVSGTLQKVLIQLNADL